MPRYKTLLYCMLLLAIACFTNSVSAQTYLETFGQNRLQNRKFQWKYFDTKHFRVYHYDAAGRDLARYVAEEAEKDISTIERKMGGQFPRRFNIILYNNFDEYRQTNIGLQYDGQIQDAEYSGSVDLVGDKLVVYFTGQHVDLKRQVRAGMAQVVLERMIFGENLRQMVKNAFLLNLPPWVASGFIAYLVDGWDTKANSDWKNLLSARPKTGFNTLSEEYPELAGKAFWEYIARRYGNGKIRTLLSSMQEKSNLNQGTKAALGMKITKTYDSCIAFYKAVYAADATKAEAPDSTKRLTEIKVPKDNTLVRNIRVSPRGGDVAYVTVKDGEYKVYLQRAGEDQSTAQILDEGRKDYNDVADPDYPMLAWSNNGYKLGMLFKRGQQTRLRIYNSFKARIEEYVIPPNRFDRVLGMTFMEDDAFMVFSAIRKSRTDLYQFALKGSRMTNITDDIWDDVQPTFISGGTRRGILFLSNRPAANMNVPQGVNELPTGPMNVFFYDTKTKSTQLLQCTDVKTGHIIQPIQYGSENFAYLYDANGIWNKYVIEFARGMHNRDSAYSLPVTNYSENILSHQYNPASNEVADVVQDGAHYKVYFRPLEFPGVNVKAKVLQPTTLFTSRGDTTDNNQMMQGMHSRRRHRRSSTTDDTQQADDAKPASRSGQPMVKSGNTFQNEFSNSMDTVKPILSSTGSSQQATDTRARINPAVVNATAEDSSVLMEITDSSYLKMKASPYRLSFRPDFFTVRLDNSILFNQYQSYPNNGGTFTNPPLSGLITVSLNDMMENHRFTGGFQLPISLSGLTYFLQYENFERRIDWGLLFLHSETYNNQLVTAIDNTGQPVAQQAELQRSITNMVQANFTYPLDRVRSVRFHTALRQDASYLKAADTLSLYDIPHNVQYTSMNRLEFVYDNTKTTALNIRYGFRYKFYGEVLYGLTNGNRSCYNLGTDFRYYHKIYRNFIWATRIAAEHSEGNNKVIFYLGGVDNWISPRYDDYVPANGGPYGYQAIATNLRGYDQNSRNGNTYALVNTELRLPIFTTFLHRPIQSSILKNLQAIAFVDAGSAWNGLLPTQDNNNNNYQFPSPISPQGNVTLNIAVPYSTGVAVGYGLGLRSMLLGYFIRADAAWNLEGKTKPQWYFAIGTDF
ncbi:MAG: hypothetical protein H0X33_03785 [Taibaiella sp.]|nr:hypothetical protein [Taibaiella sp.]